MPRRISLIVLQPTSLCNLNCSYCYVPNRRDRSRMGLDVLEAAVGKLLRSSLVENEVEFLWHAGEPLAAGLSFYEDAVRLIATHNVKNVVITKSIQTNGTLLTREWCQFLRDHNFCVGISLDGPAFLHDLHRKNWSGKETHHLVMRRLQLLRQYGIALSGICVLTRDSLRYPKEIYDFFQRSGFRSLGFNVEEIENAHANSSLASTPPALHNQATVSEEYAAFFAEIFELWKRDKGRLSIRELEQTVDVLKQKLANPEFSRIPLETVDLGIITVQKNGDVSTFSPEFAGVSSPEYNNFIIGNVLTDDVENLRHNATFKTIQADLWEGIAQCARTCAHFDLCGGAYPSNKYIEMVP